VLFPQTVMFFGSIDTPLVALGESSRTWMQIILEHEMDIGIYWLTRSESVFGCQDRTSRSDG
jgi:hypothetical protein